MKIIKVSYQKAYIIGPYLQEKVGYEAEVDSDKEPPSQALSILKKMADTWHKENNPHLYEESKSTHFHGLSPVPENQIPSPMPIIDKKWDQFEVDIDNARTLEELEAIVRHYGTFPGKYLSAINTKREILRVEANNKSMGEKNQSL